jgi:integrase
MASVSVNQRTKGKGNPWRVMWRDATGRQRQETFDRKADADKRAVELEAELLQGTYVDPARRKVTFQVAWDAWWKVRKASDTRLKTELSLADCHVLPRWAEVPLNAIEADDVQAWLNTIRERYSWETTSAIRTLFGAVLKKAVKDKRLVASPAEGVRVYDKPSRDVTADDVLVPTEVDRLVAAAPERWWTFLYCSAWLGWRVSEGLRIERRDINLATRRLVIRGTKSENATRVIPIPAPAARMLKWHLDHYVRDQRGTALVFTEVEGRLVDRHRARRILEDALKAAGLYHRGIDYRQLRHTAASLMLAAGVRPEDVSYRLGHQSYAFTVKLYQHLLPEVIDADTAALEAFMGRHHDEDDDEG